MRYVLYALLAAIATISWMNNTHEGRDIKRHFTVSAHRSNSLN